jgi:PIN domain nuclease of toxin-antitoxin system
VRTLLDTHVILWWASTGGSRVSSAARAIIEDESTEALVSVISAFEISMKTAAGRLELPSPPQSYLPRLFSEHGFDVLGVELAHAIRAGSLPMLHKDPFDRLLVAQAQVEGIPIITADPAIARYDVETIW